MKTFIKRNGKSEEFDPTKIIESVERANMDVQPSERINKELLEELTNAYMKSKSRKRRILAEDVKSDIALSLTKIGKIKLADAYSGIEC